MSGTVDQLLQIGERLRAPRRIQRQRTPGWRMPEGAVYVGRPSQWANQYRIGDRFPEKACRDDPSLRGLEMNLEDVLDLYRAWIGRQQAALLAPLRGRDLACWCPLDQPCHADVLLELANR